jgi:DHA2 family multidrug resistance protein
VSVAPAAAATPSTGGYRPLLGIAAVAIGALVSTIDTRLAGVGLADIRGGLSLGFDEGSWLSTAFGAAQMVVTLSAAWFSIVLGARRVLLWTSSVYLIGSILPPLTRDPDVLIAVQLVRGLAVGTFIPSAFGFIVRELPPHWRGWGLAAYAFRFVFSQNIADSLEAVYAESGHWQWVFWQNIPPTLLMMVLIYSGMQRRPADLVELGRGDWSGILFGGVGLTLLYAGIDQGNRLDWLNSGTIVGLLLAGGLLMASFVVNELLVARPLIDLGALRNVNILLPPVLIMIFLFGTTATSFIVPDYLTRVQGLRALQIADVVNWIALPQFVIVPLVAWLLRYLDARLLLAAGLAVIAVGSWMNTELTHDWAAADFLRSQLIEAVGLALALTSVVTFAAANIQPGWAVTIAGLIQSCRVLGNEIGSASMQTYVRIQEQVTSNLAGLQLKAGGLPAEQRTALLSDVFGGRTGVIGDPVGAATLTISNTVRREAFVLAYIDAFWFVAWVLTASLVLVLLLRPPPPNPLTPPRLPTGKQT